MIIHYNPTTEMYEAALSAAHLAQRAFLPEVSKTVASSAAALAESNYHLCPVCEESYVRLKRNVPIDTSPEFRLRFLKKYDRLGSFQGRMIYCASCGNLVARVLLDRKIRYFASRTDWRTL
jgi:hypothetical protein